MVSCRRIHRNLRFPLRICWVSSFRVCALALLPHCLTIPPRQSRQTGRRARHRLHPQYHIHLVTLGALYT
jgi:hypothetical protein